ncbi:hypothetical protein Agub_g2448 [Astrephomene gubernaculifera]|uniref:Uncharacterized protein n=1 Tax=Astrephomene gubernaculifera TaxID=47775 RepID=A0AAD3DH43_9CHLO|nr:hypothetical protein Agub_g2448 [Astrephomene gubernaculifera]
MKSSVGSTPSSSHSQPAKMELKPCQKNCHGLLLYFPPVPQRQKDGSLTSSSWRSSEPVCLGLSSVRQGPAFDLEQLQEARAIPEGHSVDYSVVLGHAVYQQTGSSREEQALPPGCAAGLEVMRFRNFQLRESESAARRSTSSLASTLQAYAKSFRMLSSDDDTEKSGSRTWASILAFDPEQYMTKFSAQAGKNVTAMSKWLSELQEAVSKPKA